MQRSEKIAGYPAFVESLGGARIGRIGTGTKHPLGEMVAGEFTARTVGKNPCELRGEAIEQVLPEGRVVEEAPGGILAIGEFAKGESVGRVRRVHHHARRAFRCSRTKDE